MTPQFAGNGHLPAESGLFMTTFALLFCAISFAKAIAVSRHYRYARWIPSGVAFAIGFLNTPSFSIARLIGGIIEFLYHRRLAVQAKAKGLEGHDTGNDIKLIVVASGFVLGEGVISVVSLLLRTFNVGVASCWGCLPGLCSGCPAAT